MIINFRITLLILCLICQAFALMAQDKGNKYDVYWRKVYLHELNKLPKSASGVVDTIFLQAKKDGNHPQIIKSLIYKSKFDYILEENAQLAIVNQLKEEITQSKFPVKNILESVLANLYWQYYTENRWRFYGRSDANEKVDNVDFRTWDLRTLFEQTHHHFQNSLENAEQAQKTSLEEFNEILHEEKGSKLYRPTLYDFLSHNALEFYKTNETHLSKPSYKFQIDGPDYFLNFMDMNLESKDSLSLQLHALRIYQNLVRFHSKNNNAHALVTADLERLQFVRAHSSLDNKDEYYHKYLLALKEEHNKGEISADISYHLADFYYQQSSAYQPKANEEHRFKKREALKICNEAIKKFPDSRGAQMCQQLKTEILHEYLSIQAEEYLPINKPSRLLVQYQNVDSLWLKIIKVNENEIEKFNRFYNDSARIAFTNSLPTIKKWEIKLRNEEDYQRHTTEALLPGLPHGRYIILASTSNQKPEYLNLSGFAIIQVTNLAIVEKSTINTVRYQVIDRNTGKPISKAKAQFVGENDYSDKPFDQTFISDRNGYIEFKIDEPYQLSTIITHNGDKAYMGNQYLYRYGNRSETSQNFVVKPYLFTDRSIYRPGQAVFFKGILIKKKEAKSEVVADEHIEVYLEDVNGQEVNRLNLKTNDFGSFSGEFNLPLGGLTGDYTLKVEEGSDLESEQLEEVEDFDWNGHTIKVEEYKRPKFEAEFKPVTATYRLNDIIKIEGAAVTFAGTNITNAQVVYRVHRKVQFPSWYYGHRPYVPYSEPQEITQGKTTTDAQGTFSISFVSIPDISIKKEDLPVFYYEVTADVTDINGETRSATTIVKVGYHAITASIQAPVKIDKQEEAINIEVDTQNLNGQAVPSKGTLKIFKLRAPNHILRRRPWEAPDYHEFSKEEFKALFPNDPYENEGEIQNWEKGALVFKGSFDTELSKEVALKEIEKWATGNYLIELETQDIFGQDIIEKHLFELMSPKDKKPAGHKLFSIEKDKNSYETGEHVKLKVGSAAQELFVTIDIEKDFKIVETFILRLNNKIKGFEIPVGNDDLKGFAIHYSYAAFNEYSSGIIPVTVNAPKEHLEIETLTFRDKLRPGEDQTWSFKVKGKEGDKVVAELLASMYDASLDQFHAHAWNFTPFSYHPYSSSVSSNSHLSFRTTIFNIRNLSNPYRNISRQFDELNWFGFSFVGNNYQSQRYLRTLPYLMSKKSSETTSAFNPNLEKGYVSGRILDDLGTVLQGANVVVTGTKRGTTSDKSGNYKIKAKEGEELIFSFVGMDSIRIRVGRNNMIDVSLAPDVQKLSEAVVIGYSTRSRKDITGAVSEIVFEEAPEEEVSLNIAGSVAGVEIQGASLSKSLVRGNASITESNDALYIVDGVVVEHFELTADKVLSTEVLKGDAAISIYGSKGANGVVLITTKEGQKKLDHELAQVTVRKNLQETAFFFPHLTTDKDGSVTFTFTAPEALTKWKIQLLAHTKGLGTTNKTLYAATQKELMVVPNPPRFLREGDEIVLSSKISNLTKNKLDGFVSLMLFDALTGTPVDSTFGNQVKNKNFSIDSDGNTQVSWALKVPDHIQALEYKIVAKSGDHSDGEQNVLPIFSNRQLVTETLPMWVGTGQSKVFTLEKLKNNASSTLKHHKLTLEITSNPAWYAVQALPYLIEYPYDCAEQVFSRYYANALASQIVNASPKVKAVFDQWASSDALISNLEKNEDLKSIFIQETPWLRAAQSETEQKKQIAMLFELKKMQEGLQAASYKLQEMQMREGGFPWFSGSQYPNRYITQHIASGFGHLKYLGIAGEKEVENITSKAVKYLDNEIVKDYNELLKQARILKESSKDKGEGLKKEKDFLADNHLGALQIHYLYMRSFYKAIPIPTETQEAVDFYFNQSTQYWKGHQLYLKGMIALVHHRKDGKAIARAIIKSLKENSIYNEELGMYWKENKPSWNWNEAPIETQALMIEAFSEIGEEGLSEEENLQTIDRLKIWLLKNKQTNQWNTTKATTEAVYALLLKGSDWVSVAEEVDVQVGKKMINPEKMQEVKVEAGTGYYKTSWSQDEIIPEMADIKITKKGNGIAWGSLYWQYFENLDKITFSQTPLRLQKKLFLKKNTDKGEEISLITNETSLKVGDVIRVRIELKADRDMEFVHMKDMRASGLEPLNVLSSYKWQDGLGYYESTKDASTNFFFERLRKGVYVFEYDLRINNQGDFSNGITTIQCMYAPEFSSHSEGMRLMVKE